MITLYRLILSESVVVTHEIGKQKGETLKYKMEHKRIKFSYSINYFAILQERWLCFHMDMLVYTCCKVGEYLWVELYGGEHSFHKRGAKGYKLL